MFVLKKVSFTLIALSWLSTGVSQDITQIFPFPQCGFPGSSEFESPHSTIEDIDLGDKYKYYQPKNVVVVGGSKGIGRAVACYWADRGKKVISLATSLPCDVTEEPLSFPIPCENEDSIINIKHDVSRKTNKKRLPRILKANGMETVDFLILAAGRDEVGSLRDWSMKDLIKGLSNNVLGLHEVWRQLRPLLNDDFALVLGVSSIAAETRFLGRRFVYHMTKQMLYELILGYAIEEEWVDPNTHYAAVLHGDAKTNFGLKQIRPKHISQDCKHLFAQIARSTNGFLMGTGKPPADIAIDYHKIYAYTKAAKKNDYPREAIPQTYKIEPHDPPPYTPLDELEFYNRLYPPEVLHTLCYGPYWEGLGDFLWNSCPDPNSPLPDFLCPGLEHLAYMIDGRRDMMCEA